MIAVVLTLAVVIGLVWGIAWLGDLARRGIGPHERYAVRFADIQCSPPPGYDRAAFLAEVRYISSLPETFQSLDPKLKEHLAAAFTAHPWVAAVKDVAVDATGAVRVSLRLRVPALMVKIVGGGERVVDETGVLLPRTASRAGLAGLITPVLPPRTHDGQVWDDAIVKRAVELVAAHHPRTLELNATGWRLTKANGTTLLVER